MVNWKEVWNKWDVRGIIIFSLSLQTILVLSAPLRKRTGNKLVTGPLWLAYLLADWAADYAVGLISKGQGGKHLPTGAFSNPEIMTFWAPFLLVHLGGPDTITAFALEDNELWLRHALQLAFQTVLAGYIFFLTRAELEKYLLAATVLVFVAGLIKYVERTYSLFLASMSRFRKSLLTEPDPGPNYAKLMDEYFSKKEAKLPTRIEMIPEPQRVKKTVDAVDEKELTDLQAVKDAYRFSETFKGLIADLIFSFRERNQSRDFFLSRPAEYAFKVVEIELNFFYEILYTKVVVIRRLLGYIFRSVSVSCIVTALVLFYQTDRTKFHGADVKITFALLYGGIALEIVAFLMLIFSDWSAVKCTKSEDPSGDTNSSKKPVNRESCIFPVWWDLPVLRRRWSGSMSQYNLMYYCVYARSKKVKKVIGFCGLTDILDGLTYVNKKRVTKDLRDFIFEELREKSEMADDLDTAKEICSGKGDWVLRMEGCDALLQYSAQSDYDESVILWHIATDLCYHTDEDNDPNKDSNVVKDKDGNDQKKDFREISKLLSDYMLYLLIMNPKLMSSVAGIGEIRFRDTCAEAEKFFEGRKIGKEETPSCPDLVCCFNKCCCCFNKCCCQEEEGVDKKLKKACETILGVNTDVEPVTVKGDRSKSVLFDACILAKKLKDLENKDKWEIISKVWVELLSYAACHCRANAHAAQLSQGGQLVTVVWLLMAHLGLGDQFQINEGHARAKLIVGK